MNVVALEIKSSMLDTARASTLGGSFGTDPLKFLSQAELGPASSQPECPESCAHTWNLGEPCCNEKE